MHHLLYKEHELSDYVTVYHRDICENGFGLSNVADAVFLDIPNPWKALKYAKEALKVHGGRICSFSPCLEQVQKTIEELKNLNFTDIQTLENLRCIYSVRYNVFPEFDFGINSSNKNATTTAEKADQEDKKDENGQKKKKKKRNESDNDDDENSNDVDDEEAIDGSVYKQYSSKPINLQPGHTGYLTFATLLNKNFF